MHTPGAAMSIGAPKLEKVANLSSRSSGKPGQVGRRVPSRERRAAHGCPHRRRRRQRRCPVAGPRRPSHRRRRTARLAATTLPATLHVAAPTTVALVAFTLFPDTVLPGEQTTAEVALDQPAPAGDVEVVILSDGNPIAAVTLPQGDISGQTVIPVPGGVPPGD